MQYTVIGSEATSADPNDRPDLVFKHQRRLHHGGTISDSNGRASAGSGIRNLPEIALWRRRRRVRSTPPRASTRWPNYRRAYHRGMVGAASTPPTFPVRRSCAAARSSITSRWWPAVSSPSSISLRWGGCGSRSPRRRFSVNEAVIGGPAPASANISAMCCAILGYDDGAIDKWSAKKSSG